MKEKIEDIYKRRSKAHEELLKCDVEIDEILKKGGFVDEMFSDEGANSMCDYWYKKGRENTIEEIRRLIDKIEDE